MCACELCVDLLQSSMLFVVTLRGTAKFARVINRNGGEDRETANDFPLRRIEDLRASVVDEQSANSLPADPKRHCSKRPNFLALLKTAPMPFPNPQLFSVVARVWQEQRLLTGHH